MIQYLNFGVLINHMLKLQIKSRNYCVLTEVIGLLAVTKIALSMKSLKLVHLEAFINIYEYDTMSCCNWREYNRLMNDKSGEETEIMASQNCNINIFSVKCFFAILLNPFSY